MEPLSFNFTFLQNADQTVQASIPPQLLRLGSFQIIAPNRPFNAWQTKHHADSYHLMQRIAEVWTHNQLTDQYLIYGKIHSEPFKWEMVPYKKCRTVIGRVFQQLQVLWRTVFGGWVLTEAMRKDQFHLFNKLACATPPSSAKASTMLPLKGEDAFCKDETIERQWVITGKKVNVLFNYAPIGFGGEKLHFLIVPKEHRETFPDVTQEEYCESLALTTKLVDHFSATRKTIKNVYLLNKTGIDAGQSVKHWHLHVVFSTNARQDFWGKLTVVKNILFGSSPMKNEDLLTKVDALRTELATIRI